MDRSHENIVRFMQKEVKGLQNLWIISNGFLSQWYAPIRVKTIPFAYMLCGLSSMSWQVDWMDIALSNKLVDCRAMGANGGIICKIEVPKILQQIVVWMS